MKLRLLATLMACFSFALLSGCEQPATSDLGNLEAHDHDHDHDHDHGHDHGDLPAHGPNKGHLFRLEGTELVGEWCHYNDNNVIRMFLLDDKHVNAVAIDGVSVTPTAGNEKTPFEMIPDPEHKVGDDTLAFMLDEQKLHVAMTVGVEVEYKMGDKTFKGKIAPHAPHDH